MTDLFRAAMVRFMRAIHACAMLAVLALAIPARAQETPWDQAQSAQCTAGIGAAEAKHGTLPGLLGAIAKAESGRPIPPLRGLQPWPWAINADGQARYFDSKQAAVAWTKLALERGVGQIDVGCMQVNLQSHPAAFRDLDQAFDPAANTDYAARFLNLLHTDAGGNWYAAVGFYHSRTPELAADYRERVAAIAEGRTPPIGLGLPLYVRAIRQGTLRIPLAGGGILRINTRRQPSLRPHRMSVCQIAAVLGDYMAGPARARCGRG
ncbi:MAG TPA: transglycosylase SLT domain-containing protein [Acetobacteraceae bacterium]|nr:transglycosylase SLT domain-containing protein [Acetobacteraceae bacterium]